jgi:hypothetical protein
VKQRSVSILFAALALAAVSSFGLQGNLMPNIAGVQAATAPPSPPVLPNWTPAPTTSSAPGTTPAPILGPQASSTPSVILSKPTARPENYDDTPSPSPSPGKDARKGIEGVWEVQIQRPTDTEYTHFQLKQDQNAVTGLYMDKDKNKFPLAGSLDSKSLRIVVTMKDGSTLVFTATLDGTTDMLGMLSMGDQSIPFTAAYRPKENFGDNINPQPGLGGLGGGGGYGGTMPQ